MNIERVIAAIRTIHKYHDLGDAVYAVRELDANLRDLPEGKSSWEGPAVTEYSAAVTVLREEGVLP